jgi:hypothetical protein
MPSKLLILARYTRVILAREIFEPVFADLRLRGEILPPVQLLAVLRPDGRLHE